MKKFTILLVLLLGISLIFVACAAPPEEPTAAPDEPAEVEPEPEEPEEVAPEPEEPAEVDPVRVGILLPLTGQDALNGQNHRNAFDFAVEEINAAGGIECLGGAPIELVYADTQGKPEAGNAETERLITQEDVITVMGAFHSGVTLPSTEIAEKYEVPYVVPNAIAGQITARGLEYVFKPRISVETEAEATAQYAAERGAETGVVLTTSVSIGEEARKAFVESVPAAGIELLEEIAYVSGATDFSDVILSVKANDPDVLFAIGNTSDATLLVRQMQELDYWPKLALVTVGGGFSDPSLVENLGPLADGIYVTTDWSPEVNLPGGAEVNANFKERYGVDMGGGTNTSYATTHMLAAALEEACSRDPKDLAETLRVTYFEEGVWNFMFPAGIKFDDTGYVEDALIMIAQITDGNQVVVWPEDLALGEETWPVPPWSER
jgi:branched-chain amino acid transport system substrate-binding protein